jgi:mRNA-degrading endonuclease RelE of RelBE toxin-antitoxin system
MVHFVSIESFRKRLTNLLDVKRGIYSGIKVEICKEFQGNSIEQIRQNRDMILINDESIVIKLRLPDKKQRLSKSDGYRLIYMVMKKVPLVVFLDVYPKRGPMQQLDIDDKEINRLILDFITENQSNSLVLHDINNCLQEID